MVLAERFRMPELLSPYKLPSENLQVAVVVTLQLLDLGP